MDRRLSRHYKASNVDNLVIVNTGRNVDLDFLSCSDLTLAVTFVAWSIDNLTFTAAARAGALSAHHTERSTLRNCLNA